MGEVGAGQRHFTPAFLEEELTVFNELRGYLPQVVTVHMSPRLEEGIRSEVAAVAARLNCSITPGHEGMTLRL